MLSSTSQLCLSRKWPQSTSVHSKLAVMQRLNITSAWSRVGLIWQSIRGCGESVGEISTHVGGSSVAPILDCSRSRLHTRPSTKAMLGIDTAKTGTWIFLVSAIDTTDFASFFPGIFEHSVETSYPPCYLRHNNKEHGNKKQQVLLLSTRYFYKVLNTPKQHNRDGTCQK